MPFLPFLIVIGIVLVAIQKIAENAPITGGACAILICLIAISIAYLSSRKKALKEATRRAIISEFKWTDNIDPLEFEQRCAEAMQLSGWTASTTRKTGYQGVDAQANKRGTKVVLQCKLYANTVGNKAVQEVFAAKTFSSANFAAVVSNSSYSRGAKELALKTGVLLLHYSELGQANLLFGFPTDGVPALQYARGVTPADVKRARHYVMFCVIASLPVFLVGLSLDTAHNSQSKIQTSTTVPTGSPDRVPPGAHDLALDADKPVRESDELSPVPPPTPLGKQTDEYVPPPPPVITEATEPTPIAPDLSSTIGPKSVELPAIARTARLTPELNQTFRDMIMHSGRSCLLITDHVWVNPAHVSLMCDRKLRVAFIQGPEGWRFARSGE